MFIVYLPQGSGSCPSSPMPLHILFYLLAIITTVEASEARHNATTVTTPTDPWFFVMVIDAGSSGSRMKVFQYRLPPPIDNSSAADSFDRYIVFPELIGSFKTSPGISYSALAPSGVVKSLLALVEYAKGRLAAVRPFWKYFPIYLRATAGMRDVVPARRDALMKECIRYLKETPFYFREDYAQVLSGEEEAAFGWLSLNADNRTLAGYNQDASLGWLDMGGASFQVAFVPTRAHYVLQNLFPLALSPRGYSSIRLYTKSYLHYGLVEANRRVSAAIISKELLRVDSVSTINNPCYFKGMDYQPDFATALFQIPLAVVMRGTGDFDKCASLVRQLFGSSNTLCWVRDCTFDGVYQPRIDNTRFVAVSNFATVADSLGLHATGSLEEWHQATRRVCSMSYEEFSTTYSHVKHRRRDGLCFDATYLYVLLSEFLKFGSAVNTTLEFRKYTRSGIELDWTSGSVTYTASATPTVTIAAYRKEVSLAYVESREGFLGELSEEALNATFGDTGLRGTKPLFVDDSFPPYSNDDDELLEELELEELLSSREPELARIPELDIMT